MASFVNSAGKVLSESASSVRSFSVSSRDQILAGSASADAFWASGSYPATLVGGAGDDIYYLKSPLDKVIEQFGGGVDTVSTWMNYTLPGHVENLTVSGDKLFAHGNDLDNIISGGAGSQTLNGFAGNDVLRGGSGADLFVVAKGNGSDVILDFQTGPGGDAVRLHDYGLKDFAAIKGAMTQVGSDVVLKLSAGETLTFRNQTVEAFQAANFKSTIDTAGSKLLFGDDFNGLSLFGSSGGTWKSTYYWGDRTLSGNGERQLYVDPAYKNLGLNPYDIENGSLVITAEKVSGTLASKLGNFEYTSGMISSEQSFSMQYGYFEMRAELPGGKGLWPAFWLLPISGDWPPELDVMEMLGGETSAYHVTAHTKQTGAHTSVSSAIATPDLTAGFHTYGVDWQKDKITWYLDGAEVYATATPADMHQPMYMIANLAVGGWAGTPDNPAAFPAEMKIDYIRAYQRPSDHASVAIPKGWAPIDPKTAFASLTATGAATVWDWSTTMAAGQTKLQLSGDWARYAKGNTLDNYIAGSNAPYNELDGGKGNDVLKGNGGIDVFVVRNGDGNDTILDFSNTVGNTDKIRLDGFHFTHFDDVKPWLTKVGADTMLRLDQDQAVLFKNLDPSKLSAEQFVFVNSVAAPSGADPISRDLSTRDITAPVAIIEQQFEVRNAAEAAKAVGSAGIDTLTYTGTEALTLGSKIENVVTTGKSVTVIGNSLDNRITVEGPGYARVEGGAGNDVIRGGDFGNDIKGGSGNDRIEGGKGIDYLVGGAGDDTFVFAKGDLSRSGNLDQVADFQGAGVAGSDVLFFEGFSSDATLRFSGYHQLYQGARMVGVDQTKQYYSVYDDGGYQGKLFLTSASKAVLADGDYLFG